MSDINPSASTRFSNCALVEIIHLHDCLRNALAALQSDALLLQKTYSASPTTSPPHSPNVVHYAQVASGRFQVIWSVFQAHSKAEDDYIWPCLKAKQERNIKEGKQHDRQVLDKIREEEYEEDHEEEEELFSQLGLLFKKLRRIMSPLHPPDSPPPLGKTIEQIVHSTIHITSHLNTHLLKEETECMPLITQSLTSDEITSLVGEIMGTRSSEQMKEIMKLTVENLPGDEQENMVKHMNKAMEGTFFEKWLSMGGWYKTSAAAPDTPLPPPGITDEVTDTLSPLSRGRSNSSCSVLNVETRSTDSSSLSSSTNNNNPRTQTTAPLACDNCRDIGGCPSHNPSVSDAEIEKVIRRISQDSNLSGQEKSNTIQTLRNTIWNAKKARRRKEEVLSEADESDNNSASGNAQKRNLSDVTTTSPAFLPPQPLTGKKSMLDSRRTVRPRLYYKRLAGGEVVLVKSSTALTPIPLFSSEELAPTHHSPTTLGCPHYPRSCKLRHPVSGRLYTCRLCCDQSNQTIGRETDLKLDRHSVTEILCMSCNALQPSSEKCVNPACPSPNFASYTCLLCNLFDGTPEKNIYHCPFCNVCRSGKGLGIDYRHCMRCNACVSIKEKEHVCISQTLQGNCPVCTETMFESTQPLRRLKCGHVMHLTCFNQYAQRGQQYTCPLCKKSVDDMSEYFELLNQAIKSQPMPNGYEDARAKIYCQDCQEYDEVAFHFVGLKCGGCGSFNTRELERLGVGTDSG
ncbi:hypothetical protein TrVE_jg37 [Triparma verrucosa]|uniref:Uncharacterized protein n=1 Tax=Triparma verrucosa TaxID=1606542 RepID=A0A9W7FHF5_9STRA|nr:hypothetical protein TrVE_jg37 [Triparma verrucosa]